MKEVKIAPESMIAAAVELARFAEEKGLSRDYILPTMEEWEAYPCVAAAVSETISKQGDARISLTYYEELEQAAKIIKRARDIHKILVSHDIISPLPKD